MPLCINSENVTLKHPPCEIEVTRFSSASIYRVTMVKGKRSKVLKDVAESDGQGTTHFRKR
jgi:hypothetical protein